MLRWRQWLRLYAEGVVAAISFTVALVLMSVYRVGSLNHPISGYLYNYGNGRDAAIILTIVIFLIALVTINFANKVEEKTKSLVDIGHDKKFIELVRSSQTGVTILITLGFLSIILDICLSG
ncbi:membrane hypothetical protein [Mesorhizobium sp. STM 4661]|nr:membrane hypothetical protein [Mesorhizobium sp. STM 4661]